MSGEYIVSIIWKYEQGREEQQFNVRLTRDMDCKLHCDRILKLSRDPVLVQQFVNLYRF